MEASNPHLRLRLPFIASAYSCTSGANQSPAVYRQSHSEQYQAAGFANSTARVRLPPVLDSKLAEPSVELNSHGDHQRVSTLTKMNCMTNSSPINSVSTDSSCNFSHSTNVNHTNQPDNSIQYEHGTHDASLTQYPQQQAKDQHTREPAQYPGDARQHPSIQRIEHLQQLEQQQQQLNYQQLVQQHSLSQQQQQQLIRYQNQLAQQLVLQQQGEQFPQSLNPVQQQYLLQQRYQQQQQQQHQQQVNLQQQISYQQQQQQYLASQSSHDSANPNQLQANQQAFLQQQLAYQQHLLSQQQAAPNGPEVKQECLDTQQQALLQQIAFQQQNIKTEVNGQQVKQDHGGSISQQQHQTAVQQQTTYQHPKSVEQGNQILKQESFGQQNLHPSLQQHVSYHPQVLVQQNLKADPTSTEQQQRNSESNDSPIPNQLVQQIAFKPDHTTQLNKEIAVQNQLILQQQLAYQHQLLAQQQQNSGKRENINPVFFQNAPETSKAESSGVLTPQQRFLQQQLAYEQQLIAQQQNLKSDLSSETHFPKQNTHSLKQETIDPSVLSNQQNLLQQQIEYQQQVLHQQTAVKSEPNEVSQKYPKESVEQTSQHQQASYPQQPDSASGKQDALVSLPVQQNLRQQPGSLPAQLGPQHQFPQLSLPRDVSQLLPGGQLIGSDSQRPLKVDSTHPLLPGQVVLPVGLQKITHPSRSVLSSASVGSVSGSAEVEFSQSCVPPPLSAIRVVPSGKVLKESNPGPAVQSDHSEGKASIRVPLQWKRLIANSMVIYVSPSNTALSSMDQLKAYLQTQGTCKCGLECPLQCDSVFSFDAKVASKPWSPVELQESPPGEFNKLCNHKRKHMTMMGLEPDTLLDGKRPDGPDFRKKRKVYGGPYSNAAGPRKPRMMPKDTSPAPVGQTPWNDPSIQQPAAAPLNPPPAIPPPSPPSGPRLPMPPPQPQASFMQPAAATMEQQPRLFRYQPAAQRVYPGTPPLMSAEGMYASNAYAKPPNPSPGEDSQNQHLPTPQSLPHSHPMLSQHASQNSLQMTPSQQEAMELQPGGLGQQMQQNQMLQQNAQMQQQNSQMQQQGQQMQAQNPQMQAQNQQMHMAQMQAMQQQAQMQAVQAQLAQQMQHQQQQQQQQQQQAAQQQQMHLSGVPTSQQQMISDPTHNVPMQTQQSLPQQQMPNGQMSQVQMKQLNQQSSQQHQMQMQHMQMQAQLAQMQQMQQEYERQNHQQSSHQPSDQYQPEPSNQVPTESANYGKFPGPVPHQASTVQDPKLMLPQQQYRQTAYPTRASYESFPPHSAPRNYPPESSGSYESINCDTIYQNNTNQSVPGTPGVPVNTYLPQPVFNYQRQTPEQLPPPTQRPTPPWQQSSRPPTPSNPTPPSPYERVPPLHPSNVQNTISATYQPVQPEASVPVSKKRTKTVTKSPTSKKLSTDATRQDATPTYPSFMDDPSGYLAQQTALLNSTISKQCDIRVTGDMLENKNLQRLARRHHASTPDSSVRNETSETPVERIKTQHADLKGPIQGGTVSTSHRSPGGILVAVEAGSPRSSNSSPGPKSPERARSMPVASGHTVSSNTLTSVLAGRSNTSLTPSLPSPPQPEVHLPASLPAKSPLEMVQSVVSSIQLPGAAQPGKGPSVSLADIKVSTSLPSHILVSSNGQLIVASQPQSLKSSPSLVSSASSSSSLMTNVTGTLPSLGLGQPTVLVNTLQAPLLFQPNIMTMDNLSTMQIPQLTVSSPVGSDSSGAYSPRSQGMISPESAKRKALKANKQRKVSPQKVTSMLLTPQQGASTGASVVMQPQQSFAQPMLQTLILPNKGNFNNQLITTALQPLNLVQQFPTIQQFLVPAGLGGMAVMSQDGTATLLQDTVQLNVLTPMQASGMFGGQSILTSPNNMVIRSPNAGGTVRPNTSAAQGQFITTNAQNQLIVNNPFAGQLQGQLSPIITNLSPNNQQLSFTSPTSQRQGQEYIQCGQTLIPISSHQSSNASPGSSLTHNSLVQQQMSLLQQANQEQTSQNFIINETGSKTPNFIINDASSKTQNFIITTSDKQPGGTNYILSPKSDTKSPGGQTHFIINTSDSKSSGQSFIITSPTDSKQLLTSGNFILTSDKSNSGNLILSTAPQQHIQQQEKVKLLQQSQQQQIQQITQQQLQQLQQSSQQLQQLQQSQQLQTQQLQQTQQIQQTQQLQQVQQQLQQAQQIQLQNHRLNMSTQTSLQPTSSAHQMVQAPPITIYVSQSQSSSTTNLYTSSSPAPALPCVSSSTSTSSVYTTSTASSVYTASPPDTTTLSPVEAGVPSPCHSLEVPPSPLLADDNQPSPTSTSVHLVSSSNTDWSDGTPDSEGFATPKASSSRLPATSSAAYVKSTSKDCVESSSSPPTHRSYSRHHHSHHHRSHSHHHHPSSKHHHSKPSREHHSEYQSHRSDPPSSRHLSHHVTNLRPDEGSDSDHSNDSSDDSNSALASTTAKLLGLAEGDLVWGQVKGYPSWPGKLISPAPTQGRVWVKWFGMSNEPLSEVEPNTLKSLSQGLEAHHRSRKKLRKSRKLNTQLENAIQEAMAELDRMSETPQQSRPLPPAVAASGKSKR